MQCGPVSSVFLGSVIKRENKLNSGKAGKPEAEQESSSHGGKVKQIANKRRPNDNNVECPQRTLQKILKREKIKKVTHIS